MARSFSRSVARLAHCPGKSIRATAQRLSGLMAGHELASLALACQPVSRLRRALRRNGRTFAFALRRGLSRRNDNLAEELRVPAAAFVASDDGTPGTTGGRQPEIPTGKRPAETNPASGYNRRTMPRVADIADAHLRHWEDAESLFARGRWANADHLYGLSAECGLKAVMRERGMPVDDQGAPMERKHREHIDKLWPVYLDFVKRRDGQRHLLGGEPFDDWSVHDSYANRSHFTRPNVAPHRAAARRICDIVELAITDSLL